MIVGVVCGVLLRESSLSLKLMELGGTRLHLKDCICRCNLIPRLNSKIARCLFILYLREVPGLIAPLNRHRRGESDKVVIDRLLLDRHDGILEVVWQILVALHRLYLGLGSHLVS